MRIDCPACHSRYSLSDQLAGKRVKCRKCGVSFSLPAPSALAPAAAVVPSPPQEPTEPKKRVPLPEPKAVTQTILVPCEHCGAKLRVPLRAVGRKIRCPKCAGQVAVAAPAPVEVPEPADLSSLLEIPSQPETGMATAAVAESVAVPQAVPTGPICPSCKRRLPAGAKVCVACGISTKTGRSIVISQDDAVEKAYEVAESVITWISWVIAFGVYPIASEAFGTRKPWTIRGIAIATILVSVIFLPAVYLGEDSGVFGGEALVSMMLWCGDSTVISNALENLRQEEVRLADKESEEDAGDRAELEEDIAALEEFQASQGQFHMFQLVTHALLHGGIFHLAGNLLFLMILGSRVNALIGNIWSLGLYPVLAVISGIAHMIATRHGPPHPMLGASGAIMGLAGMYFILFPVHKVHMAAWWRWGLAAGFRLSMKMFAVRGFWVVLFYIAFDVVFTVFGLEDEVAHWAHMGGFLAGMALATLMLICRQVNARGGDIFSAVLGKRAWALIGRPRA